MFTFTDLFYRFYTVIVYYRFAVNTDKMVTIVLQSYNNLKPCSEHQLPCILVAQR